MVSLPDVKKMKICLFVSTEYTNVIDRRTDGRTTHDGIGRACTAKIVKALLVAEIIKKKSGSKDESC